MSENGATRTIAVTSGKGGVGKTNLSVNLALQLAQLGRRTCILDADLGLANINILLGLNPDYDLEDVISNRRQLQDIMIRDFHGIDIIPGSSGVERVANLVEHEVDRLIRSFSGLRGHDFLIIDTSAGVTKGIISFCLASSEIVVVITPEPTSLTDAYALLKILSYNGFKGLVRIVVNRSRSPQNAMAVYQKFNEVVKRHLPIGIKLLGIIVKDRRVEEAVRKQQAVLLSSPQSNASKCINLLAKRLLNEDPGDPDLTGVIPFCSRWFEIMKSPVLLTPPRGGTAQAAPALGGTAQEDRKGRPVAGHGLEEQESKPPAPASSDHGLSILVESLINEVSAVSRELGLLRRAVEAGTDAWCAMNGPVCDPRGASRNRAVLLDFDAFTKSVVDHPREGDNE